MAALAAGMALTTWFNPLLATSLYDGARFLEIFILAWTTLAFLAIRDPRQAILLLIATIPRPARLTLLTMTVLAGASALRSRFPITALLEIGLIVLLLHFGCACALVANREKTGTDRTFLSALLIGALIFEILFIIAYMHSLAAGLPFNWLRPFVTFSNIRIFSQFQALTLPLLLLPLLAFETSRSLRAAVFAITAGWWALHFASGSRAVWVALIFTSLTMLSLLRQTALPWLVQMGRGFLAGGVIHTVSSWLVGGKERYAIGQVIGRGMEDSGRLDLWQAAWEMISSSPWLGVGPMHFGFSHLKVAAHPHNILLQVAAEYGLPLTLLLAALLLWFLAKSMFWCRSAPTTEDRNINTCLTAALICGLADGMFSGNTVMPQSQLLLFFISGWLIGRNMPMMESPAAPVNPDAQRPGAVKRGVWPNVVLAVIVISALMMQVNEAKEYHDFRKDHPFDWLICHHPRYWQDGHLPAGAQRFLPRPTSSP